MTTYDLILLDLDDTLFDFKTAQERAFASVLTEFGALDWRAMFPTYLRINNRLWQEFEQGAITKQEIFARRFSELFQGSSIHGDPVRANELFIERIADDSVMLPGATELCLTLKKHYPLGIVSNGNSITQRRRIEASPIRDCFSFVTVSEDIGVGKPNPKIFWYALTQAGLARDARVLMIGDNFTADIVGAHNAGFDSCWYCPREATHPTLAPRPTFTVHSLLDILTIEALQI